jgi:photosystem II stability/assembly factor-like uncharacterized protein
MFLILPHSLQQLVRSARRGRRRPKRQHTYQPLRLGLEDRFLLATYNVTTSADNNLKGSLRYAVNHTKSGDIIELSAKLTAPIVLTLGQLVEGQNVTVAASFASPASLRSCPLPLTASHLGKGGSPLMRRTRYSNLVALLALSCFFSDSRALAQGQPPAIQVSKDQKLLRGKASEFIYRFPYDAASDDQEHEEEEEDIAKSVETDYVRPRAYPNAGIDPTNRTKALANLQKMRLALNKPHIPTGFQGRITTSDTQSPGPRGVTGPSTPYWQSEGPTNINGRVSGLAIDPNNNQNLFATTTGGLWRSQTGGRRWERVSDDFYVGQFACVAINPGNTKEVFTGTGLPFSGDGVWRSTSSGDVRTWSHSLTLDGQVTYRLRIDPAAPHDVYAATDNGVYLGTRSGSSINWALLKGMDAHTTDLVVDFSAKPHIVYAGIKSASTAFPVGIWKFDGTSWQKRDEGIPAGGGQIALALATSNPKILYAKIANASTGKLLGIFKTTTGGAAWSNFNLPAEYQPHEGDQCWHNSVIEVDPGDPNTVYAGGVDLYRSTNGGTTWDDLSSGSDSSYVVKLHADHHAIIFDPKDSKNIFVGDDGGVFHATGTFDKTWHWNHVSHGMVTADFHHMATQHTAASIITGGTQDNGTIITFGNRTWYAFGGGDGHNVAFDAGDYLTIYYKQGLPIVEQSNPVPCTSGFGSGASMISNRWKPLAWKSYQYVPLPPVVTDSSKGRAALAAGGAAPAKSAASGSQQPQRLLKTTDNINWDFASDALPAGATITCIGVAPSSSFKTYYLGIDAPAIWRTVDGGVNWTKTSTGLPANLLPNALAVDSSNAQRAVAGLGGSSGGAVAITTDTGATWHGFAGSGSGAFPANTPVTGVAFDPFDANTVYAAATTGVFKGSISEAHDPPTASWVPFDDGLPAGVDVTDIFVNKASGILHVSTSGYGTFRCDVTPAVKTPQVMLVVRDNVFDQGNIPSTPAAGYPNPEDPVEDPSSGPGFYKPGDPVYWWSSPDIRIDVPSKDPVANQFASVDHVEFESTPLHCAPALPGTMLDSTPVPGQPAKVYVQVANRGLQPATKVRVMALWAEATAGLPVLPTDFWSTTFPAGSGKCGPLAPDSPWHFVDPADPCKVIQAVNPIMPEVTAAFNWNVPKDATTHSCIIAVIESDQDPIEASIRRELNPRIIVPTSRKVAVRNLHILDGPAHQRHSQMTVVNVPNPHRDKHAVDMKLTCGDLDPGCEVGVILPARMKVKSTGIVVKPLPLSNTDKALAAKLALDDQTIHTATGKSADFSSVPVPAGQSIKIGLVIDARKAVAGTSHYITISTHDGHTVLGGSTFMLRAPAN